MPRLMQSPPWSHEVPEPSQPIQVSCRCSRSTNAVVKRFAASASAQHHVGVLAHHRWIVPFCTTSTKPKTTNIYAGGAAAWAQRFEPPPPPDPHAPAPAPVHAMSVPKDGAFPASSTSGLNPKPLIFPFDAAVYWNDTDCISADAFLPESNKGFQLLLKMGWSAGTGDDMVNGDDAV